ncbi:hypothetical protein DFJ74DRAFT_95725 [Hyaloraphidium curvatum]|nr:hypothetical protein DFJ74DRAFT_95725 [Hyaloraphidium curvatum]
MAPASASLRGPPGGQAGSGSVQRASNEPGKATSKPTTIKATVLGGTDDEQLIGFRSNNEDKVARVFKMESVAGKRAPAPSRKAVWVGQTEDGSSQGLVGSLGPHHGQFVVTHQSTCTSGSPGARSASRDCSTAPPDRLEHHPDFARMKKLGSAVHDSVSGLEGGRRIKKELRAVFASAEKQMEEQARGGDNGLRILDALKRGVARCRRKADELLSDPVGCALRKAQDEAAFWEGWAGYLLEKAVMAQSEANVKRWSYERARVRPLRHCSLGRGSQSGVHPHI